jgi:poly(A) polymerase
MTQALGVPHQMRALGALFGAQAGWDIALLNAALLETDLTASDRQHVEDGSQIPFPVKPADLMPRFQGKALGDELERLRGLWLASDLRLKKNDLLG